MGNFMAGYGAKLMNDYGLSKLAVHLAGSYFGLLATRRNQEYREELSWQNNGFFGDSWRSAWYIEMGFQYRMQCE